jgi:uncharacterized protein
MSAVFGDTSYFIALLNPRDERHEQALTATQQRQATLITTVWVIQTLRTLENDSTAIILPADAKLFENGVDLFSRRPDKTWSLTDCISFCAMNEMQINDALTSDHHFEQAGFRALLRQQLSDV